MKRMSGKDTDRVPSPWEFALLAAAVFRVYRLLARDTITASAREVVTGYDDESAPSPEDQPANARAWLSTLVRCPWCLGFHLSVEAYVAWRRWPRQTMTVATPLALSAAVALAEKHLDAS